MKTLKDRMNDIGCSTFINILYPELKKDIDVGIQTLNERHEEYSKYTLNSQKSRLSKCKSIFRNEEICDALRFVIDSNRVSDELKQKAERYLKTELICSK